MNRTTVTIEAFGNSVELQRANKVWRCETVFPEDEFKTFGEIAEAVLEFLENHPSE
jgi:hypothetical protein